MKMNVWRNTKEVFKVSSATVRGKYYTVKNIGGMGSCTCPDYQRDWVTECKHIQRAEATIETIDFVDDTELGAIQNQVLERMHPATLLQDRLIEIQEESLKPLSSGG